MKVLILLAVLFVAGCDFTDQKAQIPVATYGKFHIDMGTNIITIEIIPGTDTINLYQFQNAVVDFTVKRKY